jgi:hypothetical protein
VASYTSAWLVGSARDLAYTSFTIEGDGTVSISGDYYLAHATAALSLIDEMAAQMTAAGVAGATAVITRDRVVKLASGGANFAITWSSDTGLRDLLGFTGNLSGAASYTAPNISPLLWSPGKPVNPGQSPLDCHGNRKPLAYWTASPSDGTPFVVSHGERVDQTYSALSIAMDRIQTRNESNGEWVVFFENVAERGYNFMIYPEVTEESGSSTTATLSTPLGPYVLSPNGRAPAWTFARSRGMEWSNKRADWSLACRVVPEYT